MANDGTSNRTVSAPARTWTPPAPDVSWPSWSQAQVLPRGVAIAFRQSNGRLMHPCKIDVSTGMPNGRTIYGYVGDDGRCHGISLDGFSASGSSIAYAGQPHSSSLYSLATAPSGPVPPSEGGWVAVRDARLPRGVFNRHDGRIACRGKVNNDTWPGYVNESTNQCDVFTHYGSTGRRSIRDYEVYQVIHCTSRDGTVPLTGDLFTSDGKCAYRSGSRTLITTNFTLNAPTSGGAYSVVGGRSFWLCRGAGFLGFTDLSPVGTTSRSCTDGSRTSHNTGRSTPVAYFSAPPDDRG